MENVEGFREKDWVKLLVAIALEIQETIEAEGADEQYKGRAKRGGGRQLALSPRWTSSTVASNGRSWGLRRPRNQKRAGRANYGDPNRRDPGMPLPTLRKRGKTTHIVVTGEKWLQRSDTNQNTNVNRELHLTFELA